MHRLTAMRDCVPDIGHCLLRRRPAIRMAVQQVLGIPPEQLLVGFSPERLGAALATSIAVVCLDETGTELESLVSAALGAGTPTIAALPVEPVPDRLRPAALWHPALDARAFAEEIARLAVDPKLRDETASSQRESLAGAAEATGQLTDILRQVFSEMAAGAASRSTFPPRRSTPSANDRGVTAGTRTHHRSASLLQCSPRRPFKHARGSLEGSAP